MRGEQNVFLSVDADYFANSGFDTTGSVSNIPDANELKQSLREFNEVMYQKMSPNIISCTYSPEYTPYDSLPEIAKYFDLLVKGSKTGEDALKNYRYSNHDSAPKADKSNDDILDPLQILINKRRVERR